MTNTTTVLAQSEAAAKAEILIETLPWLKKAPR